MISLGCTIENINLVRDKALSKNDGFYTFRGMGYKVSYGKVTHVSDGDSVFERAGNFNVKIGQLKKDNTKSKGQLLRDFFKGLGGIMHHLLKMISSLDLVPTQTFDMNGEPSEWFWFENNGVVTESEDCII